MLLDAPIIRRLIGNPIVIGLLCVLVGLVVFATARRTYQQYSEPSLEFDWAQRGMSDFHNGTYYPTLAFANGDNPYAAEVREKYPMARQSPIYSPIVFWLHLPFIAWDVKTSDVFFFIYNLSLLVVLAGLAVAWSLPPPVEQLVEKAKDRRSIFALFLVVLLFLLVSRPGHITLFTGYFTLELVLGSVIAIQYSQRSPVTAGLGILLASGKPTYVIPLVLLLLATRRFRAVFWGLAFAFVAGMAGLIWLAGHEGWAGVLAGIRDGQEGLHADPTELPINSWTRIDLLALVAKVLHWAPDDKVYLAAMLGQIGLVAPWLWLSSKSEAPKTAAANEATNWRGLVIALTMTIAIYHHSYDTLMIAVPMFALLIGPVALEQSNRKQIYSRSVLFLLCSVPFWNLLSTQSVRDRLGWQNESVTWQAITMVNGVCLFLALLLAIFFLAKQTRSVDVVAVEGQAE